MKVRNFRIACGHNIRGVESAHCRTVRVVERQFLCKIKRVLCKHNVLIVNGGGDVSE